MNVSAHASRHMNAQQITSIQIHSQVFSCKNEPLKRVPACTRVAPRAPVEVLGLWACAALNALSLDSPATWRHVGACLARRQVEARLACAIRDSSTRMRLIFVAAAAVSTRVQESDIRPCF
jgi:hypothetical protein